VAGAAALICAASFALVMLALAVVVIKLARTMSLTNRLINDLRKEAVPLVGKLQITLDHVNDELGHVDKLLGSMENIAAGLSSVTRVTERVVNSPLVRFLSLGIGAQRILGREGPAPDEGEERTPGK
jgi:predicted PurR-regulated permease PerM